MIVGLGWGMEVGKKIESLWNDFSNNRFILAVNVSDCPPQNYR